MLEPVKLVLNPFQPNHKKIGDLSMMVHAPLIKSASTQQTHPRLEDILIIEEEREQELRRVLVSFMDPKMEEFEFNLDGKSSHLLYSNGNEYLVTLKDIGEEEIEGYTTQKFLYFIFYVEKKPISKK